MADNGWQARTLDGCATFLSGGTPFKGNPEFWTGTIPWVSAKDLKVFRLYDSEDHVTNEAVESGSRLISAGTILMLVRGMTLHNDVPICVAMRDMAFNQDLKALQPKAGVDGIFLTYWLLAHKPELLSSVDSAGHGTGRLNTDTLKAMLVNVPPLTEQKKIASVLGALDDKIELNRRMNGTLEAMARALFQSWFVDFDPVRAKLDGRIPTGLDPATAALFPEHLEDSPLGKKPTGWQVTVLENVLAILETGGRPKGGVGGITSGVPSIGAESIVSVGVFDFSKTKFVPTEFYEGMRKGHIQSHDVLLYKDGGRPGAYEPHVSMFGDGFPFEKCSINEHVYRLRTNERLSQEYLYFWMTSEFALAEMRIKGTGVAIPGLNSTAVRSLGVLVPPPPIVEAFTKQAAPLVTRILSNAKQSRTLATLRDTLLPKLLSGELSVPTAETMIEDS